LYNSGRWGYDPIYARERWQHRQDGQWENRVAADFQNRRDNEDARPPRVWANQGVIGGGRVASAVLNIVGASLDQASQSQNDAWRFQPVDQAEQQGLAQQRQDVYRFRDQRQQWETLPSGLPAADQANRGEPQRARLPQSPIVAKSADQLDKDYTPPQAYATPPVDNLVQPKPRLARSPEQPQQRTVNRVPLDASQPQRLVEPPVPQPPPQSK
jgi:hypothetical protein